jgi:hypothetical protein
MANFPMLTRNPVYPISVSLLDNTIKHDSDGGYQVRRPRNSRNRLVFKVTYKGLTVADKTAFMTFLTTTIHNGVDIFVWTYPTFTGDPHSGQTYNVYFEKMPTIASSATGNWRMDFKLIEQ